MKTKLFSLALAFLVASSTGVLAKSKTEIALNSRTAGGDIRTATPANVLAGAKATITALPITGVTAATIVATAVIYAPRLAPDLSEAGLNSIQGDLSLTAKSRQVQAAAIVKSTMSAILVGSKVRFPGGVNDDADGASALTARSVNAVKNSVFADLLGIVVSTAVKTAQKKGSGVHNGAGGAVTGAISQVAGSSNADITNNDSNDIVVRNVIVAAAKAAPKRINDIAEAVGYAFAGTYRATTADVSEVSAQTFLATNKARLLQALTTDVSPTKKFSSAFLLALADQISAGVALAYAGLEGPGDKGVNDFAYNNGTGPAVTDVSGL